MVRKMASKRKRANCFKFERQILDRAAVAQPAEAIWRAESDGFVNRRSWVRFPSAAPLIRCFARRKETVFYAAQITALSL